MPSSMASIDFTSNIKSVTQDYTITSFQEIRFQWSSKDNPPVDLRIVQATKGTQQTPVVLLPAWKYDAADTQSHCDIDCGSQFDWGFSFKWKVSI
jgi:hypothetical protein